MYIMHNRFNFTFNWFSFDFVVVPSEEIERENERLQKVAASENTECKIFYFMEKRCRNINIM